MAEHCIVPKTAQRDLPLDRLIAGSGEEEAIEVDVAIVGAGPSGLAAALELARLGEKRSRPWTIAVLEKAAGLGEHSLSGAVVNPVSLRELFPKLPIDSLPFRQKVEGERVYYLTKKQAWRLPTPPPMRNHGNYVASLSEVVRWMGEKAEERGVDLFPGFPVERLLMRGRSVEGIRTLDSGVGRDGKPRSNYEPGTVVKARVTILAEGSRGMLSQVWLDTQDTHSENPQIFALGVKELWKTDAAPSQVIHTLGHPLRPDTFGGGFIYPMGPEQLAIGLVVGLDYPRTGTDIHALLQEMKLHPKLRPYLAGGELLEWGAKTIPEGGLLSIPNRLTGPGAMLLGDAAGLVDVASLKGIHYAMQSGILAARALDEALSASEEAHPDVASFDQSVRASFITSDLWRNRTFRLGFKHGFLPGLVAAGLSTVTRGLLPRRFTTSEDAAECREVSQASTLPAPDGVTTFSKVDAVYHSGNNTSDDIPSHVLAPAPPKVSAEMAEFYAAMCPAGVYEVGPSGELVTSPTNCVDCKATDVMGPRWTPRERGSGPSYRSM